MTQLSEEDTITVPTYPLSDEEIVIMLHNLARKDPTTTMRLIADRFSELAKKDKENY
jgi:hypothetical protein